jgi:hypothetical protein
MIPPRPRLSCVYCGERITPDERMRADDAYAHRLACEKHRRLALIERDMVRR